MSGQGQDAAPLTLGRRLGLAGGGGVFLVMLWLPPPEGLPLAGWRTGVSNYRITVFSGQRRFIPVKIFVVMWRYHSVNFNQSAG